VSEHDVETEVYERLYGHPHPDGRDGVTQPLLIVDRPLGAGGADDVADPIPRRDAARAIGAALVAAGVKARQALGDLKPLVDASGAAVRRHSAIAGALAAALVAVPLLALLLASGGGSGAAHVRLLAPPRVTVFTSSPSGTPRNEPRHVSPPTTVSASGGSASLPSATSNQVTGAARLRPRSPAHPLRQRRSIPRRARAHTSPPPPVPIRKPASQERPAHTSPPATTPTTPPPGTAPTTPDTSATGGQPAPSDLILKAPPARAGDR
jgi:hypothetical protein